MSARKIGRNFFPGLGQAVAERTILRKKGNDWETWSDVAHRVALGNSLLCPKNNEREIEYGLLSHHLSKATILLSGRHLQHGDKDQPTRLQEVYINCSTAPTSFLLFLNLLSGSGVGRCYDDDIMLVNWDYAPTLRCVISETHPDYDPVIHETVRDAQHKYGQGKDVLWFKVPDTREGWAKALELWENAAFEKIHANKMLILDFSDVRAKGTPIGGMQGRPASGPNALMAAFNKAASIKGANLEPWLQTMYIDHYLSECVVVGGARRAARIAVKYWQDKGIFDFIQIKRPIEYCGKTIEEVIEYRKNTKNQALSFLWSSNNSVGVDREFWDKLSLKPSDEGYNSQVAKHAREVFKMVTECAYGDGTGEPGFLNLDKLETNTKGIEKYKDGDFVGSKKFQINEDTQLYMSKLAKKVMKKEYKHIVNPCVTGDTKITVMDGDIIYNKHIRDLTPYDKVCSWNAETNKQEFVGLKSPPVITRYGVNIVKLEFTDGTKIKLTSDHGVFTKNRGYISANDLTTEDIILTMYSDIAGPVCTKLKSISDAGVEDVYDIETENGNFFANGVLVHNCSEISLFLLMGYCVIGDVVPFHADTLDEAEEAFRVTTRALIRSNLQDSLYKKEVTRTNRIGVGITGIHEFAWKFFKLSFYDLIDEAKSKDFWQALARFNRAVKEESETYSKKLGVEVPHTCTTIKPAGTTSALFGLTQGWHLADMKFYLRWVQFRSDDPLVHDYIIRGYPHRKLKTYKDTTIVGFPTAPVISAIMPTDKLVTADEVTPEDQFKWLMLGEKYWINGVDETGKPLADNRGNQISYTLKYNPDKITLKDFRSLIMRWMPKIRCTAVMPLVEKFSYEYLPHEPISKEKYDDIVQSIHERMSEDVDKSSVDCSSGACPIDFKERKK